MGVNKQMCIDLFSNYDYVFSLKTSMMSDFIRWFLQKVVDILGQCLSVMSSMLDAVYGLLKPFTMDSAIKEFILSYKFIIFPILAVALALLFWNMYIHTERHDFFKSIYNICLAMIIFVSIFSFIDSLNNISLGLIDYTGVTSYNETAGNIIANNTYDMYYIEKGITQKNGKYIINSDYLKKKNLLYETKNGEKEYSIATKIDHQEKVDIDKITNSIVKDGKLFESKVYLDVADYNIEKSVVELSDSFIDIGNEYYYRYTINYIPIIVTMLCVIVVYFFTGATSVKKIYSIPVSMLLSVYYGFADIRTGEKLKKIIQFLISTYLILVMTAVLLKLFIHCMNIVSNLTLNSNFILDGLIKALIFIMLTLATIDGPDLIEQLTGIDAGVSDGSRGLIATYHVGSTISKVGSKIKSGFSNGKNKIVQYVSNGFNDKENQNNGFNFEEKNKGFSNNQNHNNQNKDNDNNINSMNNKGNIGFRADSNSDSANNTNDYSFNGFKDENNHFNNNDNLNNNTNVSINKTYKNETMNKAFNNANIGFKRKK